MQHNQPRTELAEVRALMDRSTKFISVSGWSIIAAGIFALIAAGAGYWVLKINSVTLGESGANVSYLPEAAVSELCSVALVTLIITVGTATILALRKGTSASRDGAELWRSGKKGLISKMALPLIIGGILMFIFLRNGQYGYVLPLSLVFYGLALVAGSPFTVSLIRYLGYGQILLGLLGAVYPNDGIILWIAGFGVLNVLCGLVLYLKYER